MLKMAACQCREVRRMSCGTDGSVTPWLHIEPPGLHSKPPGLHSNPFRLTLHTWVSETGTWAAACRFVELTHDVACSTAVAKDAQPEWVACRRGH